MQPNLRDARRLLVQVGLVVADDVLRAGSKP
jgi:hypothetical protein